MRPSSSAPIHRPILAVCGIALLVRLLLLWTGRDDPVIQTPMLDAEYAVDWARRIAAGDVWGSPEGGAYFRPPLYAWFLALAFRLPGPDLATARLLQALLGAATAALLADVARRRFGLVAAFATGALASFAWPLLYFGRELLVSPLDLFLVAALLRTWDGADSSSGARRWLGLGVLVGLGALARPNLLVVAPAAILVAALAYGAGGLRRAAWVAAGVVVALAPVTVRNRLVSGDWVLLSTQGGINLWIGNHPDADGMTATLPGFSSWRNEDVSAWLAREAGHPLSAAEEDAHFRALTIESLRRDPVAFATGLARKTYLFFQGWEIRNNRDLYAARTRDPLLRLPLPDFGWVMPLAILGLITARRRLRELSFLWAHAAAAAAGVILVFVCARYRLAAWPALLVLAGAGVAALVERSIALRSRLFRVALVAVLVLLARVDFLGIRGIDWAQTHLQWGNVYARAGRDDAAVREFDEALRIRPDLAEARLHRGALRLRGGRSAEALPDLLAAAAAMPFSFRARRTLAEGYEALGRVDDALRARQEAVDLSAGAPQERLALATTLGMAGRTADAYAMFREIEPAVGNDPYFLLNAGMTALALKQEETGLEWLRRAAHQEATREDAWATLATYFLSVRRLDDALATLSEGLLRVPDSRRLLALRARARFFAGDKTGAVEDLEHLLELDPTDVEARRGLEALGGSAESPPTPPPPAP